jgi:DNA-directed RNA polymerase alpha subunit
MYIIESKQKSLERKAAMFEMSQNGYTYAQIGKHFGISAVRVGELVRAYKRKPRHPQTALDIELTSRTANCLRRNNFHTKQEVLDAWEAGYDFTEITNLGRKSLDEVLEWIGKPREKPYSPNWDDAPPDATWVSFDSQGNTYWFTERPTINKRP